MYLRCVFGITVSIPFNITSYLLCILFLKIYNLSHYAESQIYF